MGGGSSSPVVEIKKYKTFAELVNPEDVFKLYERGKVLGSGNMATVYQYTHKATGKKFAAKVVLKKTLNKASEFTNELEILAHLKGHQHILSLEDVFEDKKSFHLITDLVSGGELFDRICNAGTYTEQTARDMCLPILKAIHFCHENSIVHRDIKPENLLLLDNSANSPLKIADFGVATWKHKLVEEKFPQCGTPEYMAPEMFTKSKYGLKVDVWAMGCVVFIMLCGWHPFQNPDSEEEQKKAILEGDLSELDEEPISDLAKDFIKKMLTVEESKRWSLQQLMGHPWITREKSAQNYNLQNSQQKIKKYLANRRFRKVAFAVIAVNRAKSLTLKFKKMREAAKPPTE